MFKKGISLPKNYNKTFACPCSTHCHQSSRNIQREKICPEQYHKLIKIYQVRWWISGFNYHVLLQDFDIFHVFCCLDICLKCGLYDFLNGNTPSAKCPKWSCCNVVHNGAFILLLRNTYRGAMMSLWKTWVFSAYEGSFHVRIPEKYPSEAVKNLCLGVFPLWYIW